MGAGENKPSDELRIVPAAGMPLTVQYARRTLRMLTLTEIELDTVASIGNSVHLAFLGISAGAFIAFGITMLTLPIADPKLFATFAALTALAGILTAYFGVRALIDYRASRAKLSEIKRESSGPSGLRQA